MTTVPKNAVAKTLYQKVWDAHVVATPEGEAPIIYVDRHLVHEVTSPKHSVA
ncbi:hypothetical protein GCM10025855_31360 [Shewanella glacialipiscicola]|uniref:3-isopropylmalate dehydratase large subunit n=1 Tax=Shewanella glacialipiscicola TaxID=614069 RepID=A0ABQ6J628_9GAMM|nr:hypothetical protein GCM10025855_31360 [Shewanella glacialipiscicola]